MTSYSAEWILPVAGAPIRRGSLAVREGRIAAVRDDADADAVALGSVAILPALVNAHTHLELSYLRGLIPAADRMIDWVRTLMARRAHVPDREGPGVLDAARDAIREARASGTGLFGDVSNTLTTVPLLREAGAPAQVFYELLRFNAVDPVGMTREARARAQEAASPDGTVRVSLAPHAPYSVSPALFAAIRSDLDAHPGQVSSVHLCESPEEMTFIAKGSGPWRDLLETLGAWTDEWEAPGVSPVAYLDALGFLDRRVLAVHGVQFGGDDLDRLRSLDMTVVACPRSNRHVGVGSPPLEAMYAARVDVAFGTDSLASVPDLNLFSELAEARRIAPRVPARALIESATQHGARALGFDDDFGTIEVGKRARLIAVRLPPDVGDVEEYLVGGVDPDAIVWLDEN